MIKKLLILVAVVLVLALGVLGYAAYNANSLIAGYKPDIERAASAALQSRVTLGALDVSVFPTVQANIDAVRIAPKVGDGEGLSLKNLTLKIGLLPLLSGTLSIEKLSLDKPEIVFIKDAEGITIAGLPRQNGNGRAAMKNEPAAHTPAANSGEAPATVPAGLGLNLREFAITDASLVVRDTVQNKTYSLNNVDVRAALQTNGDIATIEQLEVNGTALSKLDIGADGSQLVFDLASGALKIGTLELQAGSGKIGVSGDLNAKTQVGALKLDSKGLPLADFLPVLKDFAPAMSALSLSGSVAPELNITLPGGGAYLAKGNVGLNSIAATLPVLALTDLTGSLAVNANPTRQGANATALKLALGGQPLSVGFTAAIENNTASLSELSVAGLGGTVNGSGTLGLSTQALSAQINAGGLQIEQALQAGLPGSAIPLTGTVKSLALNLGGSLLPNPLQGVTGQGTVEVTEGSIQGFNLAGAVLHAVQGIPFISGALYSAVPQGERSAVDSEDTLIRSMTAKYTIGGAALNLQSAQVDGGIFALDASGRIGFDMSLNLKTTMYFSPAFSASMVAGVKELKNLLDDHGRLVIPVVIEGQATAPIVLPDVEKLIETAGKNVLVDQAGKALGKALGGGKTGGLEKLLGF